MAEQGKETSEFAVTSQAGSLSTISAIAAMVVSVGGAISDATGHNVTAVVVVCATVAVALIVRDTIVKVAYINSRTKVKANGKGK